MRKIIPYLAWLFVTGATLVETRAQINSQNVFSENSQAVVYLEVAAEATAANKEPIRGTGFIIGPEGYVLTARHVVSGYVNSSATPITARLGSLDGAMVRADLHPMSIGIDVALLKLRHPAGLGLSSYRTVRRGNARNQSIGSNFFVIGFNTNSNISIQTAMLSSNYGGGAAGNFQWQITSPGTIYGMSGAPIFNDQGQVIAIVQGGLVGTSIILAWPEEHLEGFAAIAGWTRTAAAAVPTLVPPGNLKVCRDPSHGVERYGRMFTVERRSPEMGGGHSRPEWCSTAISVLRAEQPGAILSVAGDNETTRSSCPPFNCPLYTYYCTIRVQADPVYVEKASTACK